MAGEKVEILEKGGDEELDKERSIDFSSIVLHIHRCLEDLHDLHSNTACENIIVQAHEIQNVGRYHDIGLHFTIVSR